MSPSFAVAKGAALIGPGDDVLWMEYTTGTIIEPLENIREGCTVEASNGFKFSSSGFTEVCDTSILHDEKDPELKSKDHEDLQPSSSPTF